MVPVTPENDQVILEDDSSVSISRCWPLTFHVINLRFTRSLPSHHRRSIRVAHGPTHSLSFAHLLVIAVKVRGVVVLDKERLLHVVGSRRVEADLSIILERLSLLKQCKCIHGAYTSHRSTRVLLCSGTILTDCV